MRAFICWVLSTVLAYMASAALGAAPAHASVTLLDKADWQVLMNGFVETDLAYDSRPSFTEVAGNNPVLRPGQNPSGNDQAEFSIRNSRLAFSVLPPASGEWKTLGYVEFDMLSNQPNEESGNSSLYYTIPTIRVRHAYLRADYEGWQFLIGQYWSLFGWEPAYVLSTVSVAPGPGVVYQRKMQFTAIKTIGENQPHNLQFGLSLSRTSEKAGGTPNVDVGAKYSYAGRSSGFAAAAGDVKAEPMSVGISGTLRGYATGAHAELTPGYTEETGGAIALDTLLPIVPSSDGKSASRTLTFTGEFTMGTGYGDEFPGWSGNLPQLPYGAVPISAANTFLGQGYGGYDSAGNFQLFRLYSWNAQLQYHLPAACRSFMTAGHSELGSSNIADLGPTVPGWVVYDKVAMNFINLFHDFSAQFRGGVEYAKFTTYYVDGVTASDDRYQVSAYYRF